MESGRTQKFHYSSNKSYMRRKLQKVEIFSQSNHEKSVYLFGFVAAAFAFSNQQMKRTIEKSQSGHRHFASGFFLFNSIPIKVILTREHINYNTHRITKKRAGKKQRRLQRTHWTRNENFLYRPITKYWSGWSSSNLFGLPVRCSLVCLLIHRYQRKRLNGSRSINNKVHRLHLQ